MKAGFFMKGLGIFFIFLIIASFGIIGDAAVNNSTLNGSVLIIYDSKIIPNKSYQIVVQKDGTQILDVKNTSNLERKLVIEDEKLNISKIFFAVNYNNSEIVNDTLTNLVIPIETSTPKQTEPPKTATITPAATVTATPTQTPAAGKTSFWEKYGIILIIIGLFIISVSALLYLSKLKQEKDPEQRLVSPSIATLVNQLQIDLFDESGFVRITDAKVRAIDKRGMPYHASVGSDGTYLLELPKGTCKIEVDGGGNYESTSREVKIPYKEERIKISLIKRLPVQIEVVDETDNPASGINVSVKETTSLVDANGSPGVTDNSGFAKFTISKNKQYAVSVRGQTKDFIDQMNIPLSSSETTKRIQLFKRAGTVEITVSEQATGKPFAGIPVGLTNKGTSQTIDFVTDNSGRINQKLSIGDYIIRLKPSTPPLYDSIEKQVTIIENRTSPVALDFKFNYQPKTEFLNSISKINEKLNTGFKEVSAYDTCIPLFFKKVGEKPTQLVDKIIKRPAEFLGAKTSPDEIIKYTLSTGGFLADEISRIMKEKSNVDFYFTIQNLPHVDDLTVSDYSQEKFSELVRDTANYHKNHFREIGNKLNEIDNELTQLSGILTIQPVADLWRVAQKLQENSINETDAKKRGVMLFINDKLLDHVREMYTKEEVKARLKISMF